MSLRPVEWMVVLLAASGCAATEQAFQPTEHVEGRTVEGYREAFYELDAGGARYGEVKVWSSGAHRVSTAEGHRTAVDVGFTIDNTGDKPIRLALDRVRLESYQAKEPQQSDIQALLAAGNLAVAPDATGTVEVTFELPEGIGVSDVQAFRVKWTTESDGRSFTEYTPFIQQNEYAYVPVWGYYYPYSPWSYPWYAPYYGGWYGYPARVTVVRPYPRRVVVHGHHGGRRR